MLRKPREAPRGAGETAARRSAEPGTVDYARSFFPVALVVLVLRSFMFEPFRIPSDSMMPTLLDGDFILVNKYRLRPAPAGAQYARSSRSANPQRGDVVVFRYPPDPAVNYIKRLVGLPGDRVEVRDDHLVINGEPIAQESTAAVTPTAATRTCVCRRAKHSASTRTR